MNPNYTARYAAYLKERERERNRRYVAFLKKAAEKRPERYMEISFFDLFHPQNFSEAWFQFWHFVENGDIFDHEEHLVGSGVSPNCRRYWQILRELNELGFDDSYLKGMKWNYQKHLDLLLEELCIKYRIHIRIRTGNIPYHLVEKTLKRTKVFHYITDWSPTFFKHRNDTSDEFNTPGQILLYCDRNLFKEHMLGKIDLFGNVLHSPNGQGVPS